MLKQLTLIVMDSFPVGTNIVAYILPFVGHGSVAAGRVFVVPSEEVCDRVAECPVLVPFRYLADRSSAKVAVSVPMVRSFVMMEDLNLEKASKVCLVGSLNLFVCLVDQSLTTKLV